MWFQPGQAGVLVTPWRADPATSASQCGPDVLHDWGGQQGAWNRGRMDGWAWRNGPHALSHFRREDLPWHFALADAFTLCDQFFCSIRSATAPNRLYLMTGTIDAAERHGDAVLGNSFAAGKLRWTTYPERLEAAGISWRVYQEEDNYDDNALAWFERFAMAPPGSPLHENGMKRRVLADFQADVAQDRLPAVAWIIAPTRDSEHPPFPPNRGALYVHRYLQALAAEPRVWRKTACILVYDENGGFFDHVPPPNAPAGTPEEFVNGYRLGLGARIPALVCSPWSRGGWVSSEVCDLTSTLRFLEAWTGVAEPNISEWRRAICGDLTACFDFTAGDYAFPPLPDPAPLAEAARIQCETRPEPVPPPVPALLPLQEPGQRPLRVQPYGLECWAAAEPTRLGGAVMVHWRNHGRRAAAMCIAALAGRNGAAWYCREPGPWFLRADPGAEGREEFRCGLIGEEAYDLEVHGPNQFYRRFRGPVPAGAPVPNIRLSTQGPGRAVRLAFANWRTRPARFHVLQRNAADDAASRWTVEVAAGGALGREFPTVDDWYDLQVTLEADEYFLHELAGHVEGAPGLTRPRLYR